MAYRFLKASLAVALTLCVLSCSSQDTRNASAGSVVANDQDSAADFSEKLAAMPGANCTGQLGVDASAPKDKFHSTSYSCAIDGANSALFRLTLTTTWSFNSAEEKWQAADVSVESKTVRPPAVAGI